MYFLHFFFFWFFFSLLFLHFFPSFFSFILSCFLEFFLWLFVLLRMKCNHASSRLEVWGLLHLSQSWTMDLHEESMSTLSVHQISYYSSSQDFISGKLLFENSKFIKKDAHWEVVFMSRDLGRENEARDVCGKPWHIAGTANFSPGFL